MHQSQNMRNVPGQSRTRHPFSTSAHAYPHPLPPKTPRFMRHTFAIQLNNIKALRNMFSLLFSKHKPPKMPFFPRFLCLFGPNNGKKCRPFRRNAER
jgi:hypothetical protein